MGSFFTPEPATVTAPSTPTHTRSTQAPHQPSARVLPEEGRRTQEQRPQRHHDAPDEGKSRGFDRRRVLRPRPHLDSAGSDRSIRLTCPREREVILCIRWELNDSSIPHAHKRNAYIYITTVIESSDVKK